MITTINNKHNKLNFSNEREQSQTCLNSAEHEKNQGRKVLNVPNLRFPEFQGEWITYKIKDVLSIGNGRDYKHLSNGEIPVFGTGGYMTSVDECLYDGETTFIGRKGSINKPFYYNGKFWTVDTLFYTHSFNGITPKFTYCLFQTINWLKYNEASGVPSLSKDTIEKIKIKIPGLEEQNKIAKLMFALDERIATQSKIIDKLQSLIKGIRNKLFENDKDWRKAKIREFLCIGNGKDYKHLDIGDIPVYGTGGKMLSVNDFLYDGDSVCIGRKGTIDTPLFLTGKFWTVDTLFYTYGFKDVLPKFCYYLFKQINWQLYNEGTGVPSLSKSTIENIKVRIPSIVQQYKICYILDSYEDKIKNEGLILDLYCSQKQYLLRQMFV